MMEEMEQNTVWYLVGYSVKTEFEAFDMRIPDDLFPLVDTVIQNTGPGCYLLMRNEEKTIAKILNVDLPKGMCFFVESYQGDT